MIVLKKAITIRYNGKAHEGSAGEEVDLAEIFDIDTREADCLETRYISKFPKDVCRFGPAQSEEDGDDEKDIESLTKDEIVEELIQRDIEHDPRDKKEVLVSLLREAIEESQNEE